MLKGLRRFNLEKEAQKVYRIVKAGGLVIVPNKVGYGFNCHSGEAVKRKYDLKGRELSNKCICVANMDIFCELADCSREEKIIAEEVSKRYMVSFVTPYNPKSRFLTKLDEFAFQQVTKGGTIGIYLNSGDLEERIIQLGEKDDILIIGSSANITHTGNNYTIEEVEKRIRNGVDYIVDGGIVEYHNPEKKAGTIIDIKTLKPIRKGSLYKEIMGTISYLKYGKVIYPLD